MTSQNFSRPGAIDLSGLTAKADAARPQGAPGTPAGPSAGPSAGGQPQAAPGSFRVPVTEAGFDAFVRMSLQYPVVLLLTSSAATGAAQLEQDLSDLADADGGAWALGVADVDADPRIAQALGVQAVPTVVAVIGGQLAPLFQGTKSRNEVAAYVDEVLRLAMSNGIMGRATPVSGSGSATGGAPAAGDAGAVAGPQADPKYAAADEAMAAGRFDDAVAEFDKLIAQTPGDQEAIAGRAQAALLARSLGIDPQQVVADASAKPDDVAAQLAAADLEVIQGDAEGAFDRILSLIRETSGDERDTLRLRLLELFETVGRTDPAVLKARRQLSTALF